MKKRRISSSLFWLIGIAVLLYGCTGGSSATQGQTPLATATSSSVKTPAVSSPADVVQLQPEGTLPTSCPATPVYQGGPEKISGTGGLPWIAAQPASAGITGLLFYGRGPTTKDGTYRFIHTGGGWNDGSTTKILWSIDQVKSASPLQISGTSLSEPGKTFQQTVNGAVEIPSIVVIPRAGCWSMHLVSGKASGTIVMWVVGEN